MPSVRMASRAIDRQLDKFGIKTSDVNYVVYSRLHLNHAGGMNYFANAVHVTQTHQAKDAVGTDLKSVREAA